MAELDQHGFNKCDPPVCPQPPGDPSGTPSNPSGSPDIIITGASCSGEGSVTVTWSITNPFLFSVSSNRVLWSCNDDSFNNIGTGSADGSYDYSASFDINTCTGAIHYKARANIGGIFYETSDHHLDISGCAVTDTAIPALWCGHCPLITGSAPQAIIYIRSDQVPLYPFHFEYNGECYKIENDDSKINIDDISVNDILAVTGDVSNRDSCSDCCVQFPCVSPWTGPELEDVGTYYFEYQTYTIKDRLIVVPNFDEDTCPDVPKSPNLFDTGCVGTNTCHEGTETCPDFFVSSLAEDTVCMKDETDAPTYGFCIEVSRSQLPIGVIVDCHCDSDQVGTTFWKLCYVDPDGVTTSEQGGSECLCS